MVFSFGQNDGHFVLNHWKLEQNSCPFCSDFQWISFRMVRTKVIAITNHYKTETLEIQTYNVLDIPMLGIQAPTVFHFKSFASKTLQNIQPTHPYTGLGLTDLNWLNLS